MHNDAHNDIYIYRRVVTTEKCVKFILALQIVNLFLIGILAIH